MEVHNHIEFTLEVFFKAAPLFRHYIILLLGLALLIPAGVAVNNLEDVLELLD